MTHLDALNLRLSNERIYLANAKNNQEREIRSVWIKQLEKEIADEYNFVIDPIGDDELLCALSE